MYLCTLQGIGHYDAPLDAKFVHENFIQSRVKTRIKTRGKGHKKFAASLPRL
jgi:hypothetical protein